MEGKEEENVHHDDGTQAGNNKGNVVTLDSLNYTNIKVVNGKTNFETLNARETLLSMSKHTSHNGFQLDGFKRLSALSQTREEAEEILSDKLGEILIPSIQSFYPDHRLVTFAACAIGNSLRVIDQNDWNENGIAKYWKHLAGTFLSLLPYHHSKKEVQSYSFYLLGALLLREPKEETFSYFKEKNFIGLMLKSYQENYFDLWLWQNIATAYLHLLDHKNFVNENSFQLLGREILFSSSNSQIPPSFQPIFTKISDYLQQFD